VITAMPDFRGPTVSTLAIGRSTGYATSYIRNASTYYIYANVTDVGTPPSGTATVVANVANVTAGQTAVPLVVGSYSAGGTTYNYRSATTLTAGTVPTGPISFSVSATDAAANATIANGSVTGDNTAPAPTNISASGGIAGRPEAGDVLTLTTNDTLDTYSLLANWTGAATAVQVHIVNQGGGDRLTIWDSLGLTQLPLGTINLGRADWTTTSLNFNGSTMAQSGTAITITLGAPVVGLVTTVAGTGTMDWTPVATATDRAGNPIATAKFNEPAPVDFDF
jgi:large repetitive protein